MKRKIKLDHLRYRIIGGGLENPKNIGITSNYWYGTPTWELEKDELVLTRAYDKSTVYKILKINKKGGKALVKKIGYIQYNEILKIHRKNNLDSPFDPKGSAIDLMFNKNAMD